MRRFLILLIVLVLLAVGALLAVQLVLWSDLPRQVVVARLQQALGLDVEIDQLTTGWRGHAEARGVRVSLPLDDQPFLEAPRLRLDHTTLIWLVLTREFEAERLRVDRPVLRVVQRPEGHWNLQQVQEVLAANLASDRPRPGGPEPLPLPELALRDVQLHIDRLDRPSVQLDDVQILGSSRAALAYNLELTIPRVGGAEARLSRSAPYTHVVKFHFAPERELVDALTGEAVRSRLAGSWSGRISGQELRGTLQLTEASVAGARLSGSARLLARSDSPALVLEPINLAMSIDPGLPEPVHMIGGRLLVTESAIELEDVRFAGFDGRALVRGELDIDTLVGELAGSWEGLGLPDGSLHEGEIDIRLARRGPARRVVAANVRSRGDSDLGNWEGSFDLTASGETLTDLAGTLRSRELRYELRGQRYRFADFTAALATDERSLRVDRFELTETSAAAHVVGQAGFDWQDRTWSLTVDGRALTLPSPAPPLSRVRLDARGDLASIELRDAEVETLGMTVQASGSYDAAADEPLSMKLGLRQVPIQVGDEARPLVRARNVVGELEARGTLRPLNLTAEGDLVAQDLQIHHDVLGDVALTVALRADDRTGSFEAEAIEWLGGQWLARAVYDMQQQTARVHVDVKDVDLAMADGLLATPVGVELGRANLSLTAEGFEGGLEAAHVQGDFNLRELKRGVLTADRVDGRLELLAGRLHAHDVVASQGEGRMTARAVASMDRPTQVRFDLQLDDWPLAPADASALETWVTGEASGDVDVATLRGQADAALAFRLASGDLAIGRADMDVALVDSRLHLRELVGRTLRGTINGVGSADLHDVLGTAELDLQWESLSPRELQSWVPMLAAMLETPGASPAMHAVVADLPSHLGEMTGTYSGSLTVQPADDARALGPLRVELLLEAEEAGYRGMAIGNGRALAFVDRDRLVLRELMLATMGGHVGAWGRLSEHGDERFVFASAWLADIDLAVVSELLRPGEIPLPGRVSAELSMTSPAGEWRNVSGTGTLSLRASDIATIPLFSVLYDLMNIRLTERQPEGRGQAQFRFEEGVLLLERFYYQNRGATIRLAGRAEDIWHGLDSPFTGFAQLSLQPLPDVEFLDVLNEAFTALQADVTSVRLTGRINAPDRPQVVPFRGFWDAVRRVMGRGER